MSTQKQTVWILEHEGSKAVHFSLGCLIDGIKLEFEDRDHEGMGGYQYKIYTSEMTEEEINDLPEFDGF